MAKAPVGVSEGGIKKCTGGGVLPSRHRVGALRLTRLINKKKLAEAVTHIAGYSLKATCFHPLFDCFFSFSSAKICLL